MSAAAPFTSSFAGFSPPRAPATGNPFSPEKTAERAAAAAAASSAVAVSPAAMHRQMCVMDEFHNRYVAALKKEIEELKAALAAALASTERMHSLRRKPAAAAKK
jgi:signal transduction protein with GAF and PtsI domain